MLTSRVATTATRINYRRHFSTDVSFEQTHPNSRERVSRKVIAINWRRLRIRENEKGRKKRNLKKRLVSKLLLDGREKFFRRNLNGTLRSKRNRRKKERKKFRPRYLPFTLLFRVASPGRITRYRVFSRKKEGAAPSLTIVPEDGQGSMTPKFTKPSLSLLLRLRNLRIAGFLYRAFSNRTVFRNIGRGKAVLENNDILSRTSLSSCLPRERLQDFLAELLYLYIRISMHIGLSATTFCSHDKSDTITDGLNGWRKDAGDLELERRSCVGLLNDWIGIDRGSNFIYYCSPRYIYIYTYIRCTFECAIGCPEE